LACYGKTKLNTTKAHILISALHKFVTHLLRHLPTYLQPQNPDGVPVTLALECPFASIIQIKNIKMPAKDCLLSDSHHTQTSITGNNP